MDSNTVLTIVSLTALLLAGASQVQLFLTRRRLQRSLEHERAIRSLRDDVGALCAGAAGVGDRVTRLEQRVRRQNERQDQMELRGSGGERPYQQAVRLVQNGADVDELIKACGLTPGEAELIAMMHRLDKAG